MAGSDTGDMADMLNDIQTDSLPEFDLSSITYSVTGNSQYNSYENIPEMGEHFKRNFIFHGQIGSGFWGEVVSARHKKDKQFYAIKKIRMPNRENSDQNSLRDVESLDRDNFDQKCLREVESLARLNHSGVVRYHTTWEDKVNQQPFLFIQMEWCQAGTLSDWLAKNTGPRSPEEVMPFCTQILQAINYIHRENIIHRDLKPSNIFISTNHELKIGDFGLATMHNNWTEQDCNISLTTNTQHTAMQGTMQYMSPEQLARSNYDTKVDIFSTGLIFLELCRSFPYPDITNLKEAVFQSVRNGGDFDLAGFHESKMKTIVQWMTESNPTRRPTADELLTKTKLFVNHSKYKSISYVYIDHAENVVIG